MATTQGRLQHRDREFAKLLREAVPEGLKNVIGESGMQAILFHLQLSQFSEKPSEFHNGLSSIFKEGAIVLEKMIMKELFRKLNLSYYEMKEFNFQEYITFAKRIYEDRVMER